MKNYVDTNYFHYRKCVHAAHQPHCKW